MNAKTISYADFHIDTVSSAEDLPLFIDDPTLQVPLSALQCYRRALIYYAIFTPPAMSAADGYRRFLALADRLRKMRLPENISTVLTVEDARILGDDEEAACARLGEAYTYGVRLITPVWRGENVLGGAHDTCTGLSPLGNSVIRNAAARGILVDISHASPETADAILSILNELSFPAVATHSNAFSLCPHTRNLRDIHFDAIVASGGIVGVSLYRPFLSQDTATLTDVLRHIDYFCARGGERNIAIGSDFDGAELFPDGAFGVSDMPRLYEAMLRHGYPERTVKDVFYGNLARFTDTYIRL